MSHIAATDQSPSATVAGAVAGDRAAFARLIAAHHDRMMRVAHVITGDPEAAADAVQSAWEKAWKKLGELRDREQVGPWLIAIAANEARQQRRRQMRHSVVDISSLLEGPAGANPADEIDLVDLRREVGRLNAEDRTLLALRFVAHFDSETIAKQLGISASGARSRLMRLLDRLRDELEPGGPDR
jgi:RNA polymerase sigma-70 factor, ECF subfamily